jgi:hypothetical protein
MASQSKVVHGKNNFPSGFLLGHRHVPVPQVRSWPHSNLPLGSSSDDGDDDDNYHDNDTTPMHCIDIFIANVVGANFLFLLMATRETATAVMTMTMTKMTKMTTTTTTMTAMMMMTMIMTTFPKLPYHLWLQVVTPPLLLVAPFMEMILIGPVVIPILSNQVVTGMLSVAAMTLMSCCCHALTTLCNNAFLLLTPPCLQASIIIRNVMLARKLTVTRLAMIHQKLETIVLVADPKKVQVLMPAIPVSQCPTRSNQVPGCLSRLVTFRCQMVVQ